MAVDIICILLMWCGVAAGFHYSYSGMWHGEYPISGGMVYTQVLVNVGDIVLVLVKLGITSDFHDSVIEDILQHTGMGRVSFCHNEIFEALSCQT